MAAFKVLVTSLKFDEETFFCLQSEIVLGGDNPEHREPFESFVKEYLQTGKNIILTIISVDKEI